MNGKIVAKGFMLTVLLFLGTACVWTSTPQETEPRYDVGYRILDLPYEHDGIVETMTVAVWYPTSDDPEEFVYGGPTIGNLAVDGALFTEDGPYPLLVYSHGYGGSGLAAVFLTEMLASHGWIVAAPDHHDPYSAVRIRDTDAGSLETADALAYVEELSNSGPEDREKYLFRLEEMQFVLNSMVDSEEFASMIDQERIAVGGHSFGGFTALGVSGTLPEYHDERIKGLLLFSTGAGGYLFSEEELSRIDVPMMLYMGEKEREQTRNETTMLELAMKIYDNAAPPKYFVEIKNGTHFSFNNGFKDTLWNRMFRGSQAQHQVIADYAIAFLETVVAGRTVDAAPVLDHQDRMVTMYLKEE